MTIKRQFITLTTFILLIPILCSIFIFLLNYYYSSKRVLVEGYKNIEMLESKKATKEEEQAVIKNLKYLPGNVEVIAISSKESVIYSTFPDFITDQPLRFSEFWNYVRNTSNKYFYQFTAVPINDNYIYISSRVSRHHAQKTKDGGFLIQLQFFIFGLIIILIIMLILIFNSIFRSIILLDKKTAKLASGDLSTKFETDTIFSNEIISLSENLDKMRKSLLEAQNRKNKFIMGISHDLRTPLSIIKGYTEAISDGIISEPNEIKNTLTLLNDKISQLEEMIDTLINFTKLNTSEIRDKMQPTSITKIIKTFAKSCQISGPLFKRNIFTNIQIDKDIIIPLDEQLINRAFENIFSNAVRYSKENDKITISAFYNHENITLEISDTGIGIDKKDIDNIFDLFYRASGSRKENGMGIGLSVVKNIIDTHGWYINVISEKGIGSTFRITIPYSNSENQ